MLVKFVFMGWPFVLNKSFSSTSVILNLTCKFAYFSQFTMILYHTWKTLDGHFHFLKDLFHLDPLFVVVSFFRAEDLKMYTYPCCKLTIQYVHKVTKYFGCLDLIVWCYHKLPSVLLSLYSLYTYIVHSEYLRRKMSKNTKLHVHQSIYVKLKWSKTLVHLFHQ